MHPSIAKDTLKSLIKEVVSVLSLLFVSGFVESRNKLLPGVIQSIMYKPIKPADKLTET